MSKAPSRAPEKMREALDGPSEQDTLITCPACAHCGCCKGARMVTVSRAVTWSGSSARFSEDMANRFKSGWIRDVRIEEGALAIPMPSEPATQNTRLMKFVGAPTVDMPTRQPVLAQGPTSSCVAQATSRAIHVYMLSRGHNVEFPSVLTTYVMARLMSNGGGVLRDAGSYPRDAIDALSSWGAVPESRWPFDPAKVNEKLDLDLVQDAATCRVSEWRRIGSSGKARELDVKAALDAGFPVIFGVDTDEAFESYSGGLYERGNGPSRGGHMVCCLGYAERTDGSTQFWIVNSWSPYWGSHGWMTMGGRTIGSDYVGDVYALAGEMVTQ